MRKLLSGGLAMFAGIVSLPAPGSIHGEQRAPVADHRLQRLQAFFGKADCPAKKYSTDFLVEADELSLDWRLLPSISYVESTGGKSARTIRRPRITPDQEVTRLYIGAGRKAKIRPGDLVGAIVNEVGVDARAIGAIQISDRFSLVEVPEDLAEGIITALRATTIKGKRVPVRRDQQT